MLSQVCMLPLCSTPHTCLCLSPTDECSSRAYGCSPPHTGGCSSAAEGVEGGKRGKIRRRSIRESEWDVAPERRGEA